MRLGRLSISSPDIGNLGPIADAFTADGGQRAPRLDISGVPDPAVELAVMCHDPDAPLLNGFTHWVVYGIDPAATTVDTSAPGVRVGPNGTGRRDWFGPQPPPGHGIHHYYFWVYALERPVHGTPTREEFLRDHADAVIEQARFVGLFERR